MQELNLCLTICQRIKEVRLLRNYKQEYLAAKLGCSLRTYQRLEMEGKGGDIDSLEKICAILEIEVNKLMDVQIEVSMLVQ